MIGGRPKPTLVVPRDVGMQAAPSFTLASSVPGCTIERGRLELIWFLRLAASDVILIFLCWEFIPWDACCAASIQCQGYANRRLADIKFTDVGQPI